MITLFFDNRISNLRFRHWGVVFHAYSVVRTSVSCRFSVGSTSVPTAPLPGGNCHKSIPPHYLCSPARRKILANFFFHPRPPAADATPPGHPTQHPAARPTHGIPAV